MQCPIHTHASNSSRFYTHPWFPSSKVLLPGDVAVIRAIEQGKDHPRRSEVTCELHCLARRMPRATRKKHFSSKISFTWVDLGGRSRKSLLRYCNTNSNGFLGAFRTFYIPLSFLATDSRCTVVASWHNDSVLRSPHWTLLPWVHHCHLHPRPPRSPWRLRDTIGGRNHWNLFFDLPPSLTSTESWNLMKSPRAKTCGRSLLFKEASRTALLSKHEPERLRRLRTFSFLESHNIGWAFGHPYAVWLFRWLLRAWDVSLNVRALRFQMSTCGWTVLEVLTESEGQKLHELPHREVLAASFKINESYRHKPTLTCVVACICTSSNE